MLDLCAMLPRSSRVEPEDFDVDIKLIRVDDYAFSGLVYHYILEAIATSPCDGIIAILMRWNSDMRLTCLYNTLDGGVCSHDGYTNVCRLLGLRDYKPVSRRHRSLWPASDSVCSCRKSI